MGKKTKGTCVYFLRDPQDMTVRYIGITMNPIVRMRQHLKWACGRGNFDCSHPGTEARFVWINGLFKQNLEPIMEVRFRGLDIEQARRVEGFLIKQTIKQKPGQLYQADTGRKSPLIDFDIVWGKCNVKERDMIRRFVLSEVAS